MFAPVLQKRIDIITFHTTLWYLDPFVPNAPFLYPLKTSENLKVFCSFQGVGKGYIGNEWVKSFQVNIPFLSPL